VGKVIVWMNGEDELLYLFIEPVQVVPLGQHPTTEWSLFAQAQVFPEGQHLK
jgi:hypothetical protein